jgi:hypothetical protein
MAKHGRSEKNGVRAGVTGVSVSGYKSLSVPQGIDIRPLTILAGANSSGKSSLMQPLLLLKQTLEASYDPGPLLLNGPNVKFTSVDQLLSRTAKGAPVDLVSVGVSTSGGLKCLLEFSRYPKHGVRLARQETVDAEGRKMELRPDMPGDEISRAVPDSMKNIAQQFQTTYTDWRIIRNRCFLEVELAAPDSEAALRFGPPGGIGMIQSLIRGLIHLPGLRGNPARTYPVTAVGETFPGSFEAYVASILVEWQRNDKPKLAQLGRDLESLGLTWKVAVSPIDDTQVEMQVGRLPHAIRGGAWDMVSLADVGFGVSQTLPVLVALLAAENGQLVYLEQPEIHLHPRAQSALAEVIAAAAGRGARVVVETHSNLLLLGFQTVVREGRLPPSDIKLHWFKRNQDGSTEITSADLDSEGRFGDWPEDFAEVLLNAEGRYLDAGTTRG